MIIFSIFNSINQSIKPQNNPSISITATALIGTVALAILGGIYFSRSSISIDPNRVTNQVEMQKIPATAKAAVLAPEDDILGETSNPKELVQDPYLMITNFGEFSDKASLDIINMILKNGNPSKEQIKKIYQFFSKFPERFKDFLKFDEDPNFQFETFLKILDMDLANDHIPLRTAILEFAFSSVRFEWIQLQEKDVEEKLMKELLEFEKTYQSQKLKTEIENLKNNSEIYKNWIELRMCGSSSIVERNNCTEKAIEGWFKADLRKSMYAKRESISFEDIKLLHRDVGREQEDIPHPGQIRKHTVRIGSGNFRDLPPADSFLEGMTAQYENWLTAEMVKCQNNKKSIILTAAQAYQRLVSIHPFENGNGRVSRFMMDYVLESFGLPPGVLGKEVNDAVFSLRLKSKEELNAFVRKIFEGVKMSHEILKKDKKNEYNFSNNI